MTRPLWPATLLLVCACNGGDDADGGRVLGELNDDEVQAVCDSIEGALARTRAVQARCTLEAASSTESAAECAIERDECVQAGGDAVETHCTLPERRSDELCADLQVDEVLPCIEEFVDARLAVSCEDWADWVNAMDCRV